MDLENERDQSTLQSDDCNVFHHKVPLMLTKNCHNALKASIYIESKLISNEDQKFSEKISNIERLLVENKIELKLLNGKLENLPWLSCRTSTNYQDFFNPQNKLETDTSRRIEQAEKLIESLELRFEENGEDADRRAITIDPFDKIWRKIAKKNEQQ